MSAGQQFCVRFLEINSIYVIFLLFMNGPNRSTRHNFSMLYPVVGIESESESECFESYYLLTGFKDWEPDIGCGIFYKLNN